MGEGKEFLFQCAVEPFDDAVLPGTADACSLYLDAHIGKRPADDRQEDAVVVHKHSLGRFVEWERFAKLLCNPFTGRVEGRAAEDELAPGVVDDIEEI